jgi:cadmium resistance protein CadD (predicted permease)
LGGFPIAIGIKELLELCKTNENDKDDEKELHREITFAEQEDIAV